MLVVYMLLIFFYPSIDCALTPFRLPDPKSKLAKCVSGILVKYYREHKLSYFNFVAEDDELLDDIHVYKISVVVRTCPTETLRTNEGYMIIARNEDEFSEHLTAISSVGTWNPLVRFLIVIDSLVDQKKVFNSLLKVHAYNIVVVNGTETTELYTYNPFENSCGKYYNRIIELGKCDATESVDLYPEKVKDLRNCFFNVSCPHWPPFSINPSKSKDNPVVLGTEQYIFDLMSTIEQFKYNFTYNYDAESFTTVSKDLSVSGPMTKLLANRTDVMLGGLILTYSRARRFSYVHGHLDQIDEIRIMVKKASTTPTWKNFYLEFTPLVWALLLLVLVFYTILVTMLIKTQDKGHVVLVLLDHLLLHGPRFQSRPRVNVVFICWVWFAYLINCFYQSSLVSLTTMPSSEYQIKDEQSLTEHGLKSCVSSVMRKFVDGESNIAESFSNDTTDTSCERLMQSIRTVSKSPDRFTISLYNVYLYNRQVIYDKYGNSPVYSFLKPYNKVVYAMYMYKGFPLGERLHILALRIRETGLSDKNLRDQYYLRQIKYNFQARGIQTRFAVPWYVYIVGVSISTVTFFVEVSLRNKQLLIAEAC